MSRAYLVWVPPSATTFSCLCEACLELARGDGRSFVEAVRRASVRGRLPTETDVSFVHCSEGHEVVVRRVHTPAPIGRRDGRQLQIV
jgi:hypothetical protein